MDAVVMGAVSSLIVKLGRVLVGEYNLQSGVKAEIMFLQPELESMRGALEEIADVPADQLESQDKIWASEVRELCYDIEDSFDTFMVRCCCNYTCCSAGDVHDRTPPAAGPHGMRTFIDRSLDLLTRFRVRRKLATDIRGIKRRLVEVRERREAYRIVDGGAVANNKPAAAVDPRLLAHYASATRLVGIQDRSDELVRFLLLLGEEEESDDEAAAAMDMEKAGKVVSVVGFGGLGKTTLANVVSVRIRPQFDCCAFVTVSQKPDMKKLFKSLLLDLTGKDIKEDTLYLDEKRLVDELRGFLQDKRYLIIIDDIWDISVWNIIRCALPDNNCGYRIITTTRILDVAEQIGGVYQMKPLCPRNSKILLYSRIFGSENKDSNCECPDEQLVEVSDKILQKCAGVPLAIITIASLLASKGRNKLEWSEVCSSIGVGLENSRDVENMRKILLFSYYDLPSYLRKCLLYISVFPEDYEIERDRLIRMWIAEDLIGREKQGKSLFEVGESYFNELINKSMIQPVFDDYEVTVSCCVHDMILELIRYLSNEQNFVTILNGVDLVASYPTKNVSIRRLCFHNSNEEDHATSEITTSMQQVRSVVVFTSASNRMPALGSFSVLRVLDLGGCDLSKTYSLKYLGNLLHLRYLGLFYTRIAQLPEEMGNLKILQTLDISLNPILALPTTIVELRHLTCLLLPGYNTNLPERIGRLTSIEELSFLDIKDSASAGIIIEQVCSLTKLRVLSISWTAEMNEILEKSMVGCLNKLQKLQRLGIFAVDVECSLDGWVAPPSLSKLELCYWLPTLPDWMNPSLLQQLWFLQIQVRELQQEDLQILGRLPALRYLHMLVDHENLGITRRFTVGAACSSFPCLVECKLWEFGESLEFRRGAMPRLRDLTMSVLAGSDGGTDFGLGNLQSLQRLGVSLIAGGASEEEVEEVKAAVRHAMEIHPNHPSLDMY